jgi:hypothetical protein
MLPVGAHSTIFAHNTILGAATLSPQFHISHDKARTTSVASAAAHPFSQYATGVADHPYRSVVERNHNDNSCISANKGLRNANTPGATPSLPPRNSHGPQRGRGDECSESEVWRPQQQPMTSMKEHDESAPPNNGPFHSSHLEAIVTSLEASVGRTRTAAQGKRPRSDEIGSDAAAADNVDTTLIHRELQSLRSSLQRLRQISNDEAVELRSLCDAL